MVNTHAQEAYVCAADSGIYRIDISNCSSELIAFGPVAMADIAINPVDGQLYAVSITGGTTNADLYSIDLTTGEFTFIGVTGAAFNSLVGSPSGMLYGVEGSQNDNLYLIDPANGNTTIAGNMGTMEGGAGDLTFYNGNLHLASSVNNVIDIPVDSISEARFLGQFQGIVSRVLGLSSIGCPEEFFVYTKADVYSSSPADLTAISLVCPDIVPKGIYGGASLNASVFGATRLELPNDTVLCEGDVLTLDIGLNNDLYTYSWQGNEGGPTYTIDGEGTYIATIESGGCTVSDTIEVEYLNCIHECYMYAPTSFTPNGDELNDLFIPKYECLGDARIEDYNLSIYNRWGEIIFETPDILKGWDGNSNGNLLPAGIYFYHITAQQVVDNDPEDAVLIDLRDRLLLVH